MFTEEQIAEALALYKEVARLMENGTTNFSTILGTLVAMNVLFGGGEGGGGGGSVQYAEDSASINGELLTMAGVVRRDTPSATTSADGDRTSLITDNFNRLRISPSELQTAIQAATNLAGLATSSNQISQAQVESAVESASNLAGLALAANQISQSQVQNAIQSADNLSALATAANQVSLLDRLPSTLLGGSLRTVSSLPTLSSTGPTNVTDSVSITVPGGQTWEIISIRVQASTSVTTGSRFIAVDVLDASDNTFNTVVSNIAQPEASTKIYNFSVGNATSLGFIGASTADFHSITLPLFRIPSGWKLRIRTRNTTLSDTLTYSVQYSVY